MGTEEEAFDASPNGLQSRLDRFLLRRIDRRLPGRNDRFRTVYPRVPDAPWN